MFKLQVLCLVVAAAVIGNTDAISDENREAIRAVMIPIGEECSKEMEIPVEEVRAAYENRKLETLNGCLLACIYKKSGLINAEGKFELDTAINLMNKIVKGDDKNSALEVTKECASVNEKSVTDGNKGCERSSLLAQCYAQNIHRFTLV